MPSYRTAVPLTVLALAAMLTACSPEDDSPSIAGGTPTPLGSGIVKGIAALTIKSFTFDPTPLTVKPGARVAVTNKDQADHDVTSDQDALFVTPEISENETVSFTAPSQPGTYTYFCNDHKNMKGTLVVSG